MTTNRNSRDLLSRLQDIACHDADNPKMVAEWRHAAAFVSGTLSMRLELLPVRSSARHLRESPDERNLPF